MPEGIYLNTTNTKLIELVLYLYINIAIYNKCCTNIVVVEDVCLQK